jgi:hypothetical protein
MMSMPSRITVFLIATTLCCVFWVGCRKEGQDDAAHPDQPPVQTDTGNPEVADLPAGNVPDWDLGQTSTLLLRAADAPALEGTMLRVATGADGAELAAAEQYVFVKDKSLSKAADPKKSRAVWQVDIPADGTYNVWIYSWWFDACANSVYLNIKNGAREPLPNQKIGDDGIVKKWHWVPLRVPLKLKAGAATILLKCREDGARVGAVLLTTKNSIPQGSEG